MKTSTSEQQHSVLTDIVVRSKYEIHRWLSRDASRSLKALPKPDHLSSMIRRRHLRKYYTTFGTVVDLLEARDIYTADHSKRVVTLCFRLCMLTRMPMMQMEQVIVSAAVHDIGKIGVSDAILRKPDRLDEDEFREIQKHSTIGADLLKKNKGLEGIATNVRHHHERWDGKGYPDGLIGNAIPQTSRILAVCDSIDAMMSDRPYREGMSAQACRNEISKNAWVMYDPQIAETSLSNWDYIMSDLYEAGSKETDIAEQKMQDAI